MTGILAAGKGGVNVAGIVQSVPLVVFYLITVGVAGFAAFKLKEGSVTWHKILPVFMFVLGAFITVAIPKASASLGHLASKNERLYVVVPLVILALVALIMTFLENKDRK